MEVGERAKRGREVAEEEDGESGGGENENVQSMEQDSDQTLRDAWPETAEKAEKGKDIEEKKDTKPKSSQATLTPAKGGTPGKKENDRMEKGEEEEEKTEDTRAGNARRNGLR